MEHAPDFILTDFDPTPQFTPSAEGYNIALLLTNENAFRATMFLWRARKWTKMRNPKMSCSKNL
jgi:hypothetical protein